MTSTIDSKKAARREMYRRRREIVRSAKQRAKGAWLLGFGLGVTFGYVWAANAYGQHIDRDRAKAAPFHLGPAIVHHAPDRLPTVPATGEGTGL